MLHDEERHDVMREISEWCVGQLQHAENLGNFRIFKNPRFINGLGSVNPG